MKVILLQEVKALGKKGEAREVAEGYARNFLFPKKLAVVATSKAIKIAEEQRKKREREEKDNLEKMKMRAREVSGKNIAIKSKAKDKKLFGSVSAKDIAKKIGVEEKTILLDSPIKKTGNYEIKLKFAEGIEANINLEIIGE